MIAEVARSIARVLHRNAAPVAHQPGSWTFQLVNGRKVSGEATCREGWLELRVPLPDELDRDLPWTLLRENGVLNGAARFARHDVDRMGIVAEAPLGEAGPEAATTQLIASIQAAAHLHQGKAEPPAGVRSPESGVRSPGSAETPSTWTTLGAESGWLLTQRDDGSLGAELDAPGVMNQAQLSPQGEGATLSLTVFRTGSLAPESRRAIALFALTLTSQIRLVRAALGCDDVEVLRFEVGLTEPSATQLDLGLESLSLAARLASREVRALAAEPLARTYLAYTTKE